MPLQPYRRKAQYHETDQMKIIHHSNYIRWFEETRIDYHEKLGFPYELVEEHGIIIPVLSVECVYRSMVRFGDTVLIHCAVSAYTGTRLSVTYRVTDADTGDLRTTGNSEHCFLASGYRPVSLRKALPALHDIFLRQLAADREEGAAP